MKSSDKVLTKTATASHHIHANSTTILAPSPPITSTAGVNNRISTALASDINNVTKQISSRVPAAAALPTANPLPADDKQASQQPILSNTMSKKQTDNTTSDTVISHSADNTGNTNSAKDDNSVTVKTPTSEKTTTMTGSNTGGMGPLTPGPGHATSEEVKKMGGTDVPTYKTARMPIFVVGFCSVQV